MQQHSGGFSPEALAHFLRVSVFCPEAIFPHALLARPSDTRASVFWIQKLWPRAIAGFGDEDLGATVAL